MKKLAPNLINFYGLFSRIDSSAYLATLVRALADLPLEVWPPVVSGLSPLPSALVEVYPRAVLLT